MYESPIDNGNEIQNGTPCHFVVPTIEPELWMSTAAWSMKPVMLIVPKNVGFGVGPDIEL